MALKYRYKCKQGHSFSLHRDQDDRNKKAKCKECGSDAERDWKSEFKKQNPQSFNSYVEDVLLDDPVKVTSRKQKKKIMKEEGVKEKYAYT